jgi:SAM-dependent methyltransferase
LGARADQGLDTDRVPEHGEAGACDRGRLADHELREIRRTRRHPRLTQFDYLHRRRLVDDLQEALGSVPHPVSDVLDVYCGTRPYDDLLPSGARSLGMDIDDHYGPVDVITSEFLPFEDESFDLVMCIEAFYYVPDPEHGAAEIRRVLRPGGTAVVAVPLIWEYNRTILEHRFTGPELEELFSGWEAVKIVENGGRGVSWSLFTGRLINRLEFRLPSAVRRWTKPLFRLAYVAVNGVGFVIEATERRYAQGELILPPNLLLTARRPAEG